jgi:hypothetical protein
MTNRRGNCGCFSVLAALVLLPVISTFPVFGFFILVFLLGTRK